MNQLRVWHMPQLGHNATYYVPVKTPEEGRKVMMVLASYDLFQLENNIKPDFSNACGLQEYDEEDGVWYDWYSEEGLDIKEHFENNEHFQDDSIKLFGQLKKR